MLGASQMAKLRVFTANKGEIYDLVKFRKEKEQRVIQEKIKEAIRSANKEKLRGIYS